MLFNTKFYIDNSVFLCFWIFAFICEFGIASNELTKNNHQSLNLTKEEWTILGKHLRDIFSKDFKLNLNPYNDDTNTTEFNVIKLKKRLDKELFEDIAKKGNLSERSFIYYPIHKPRAPYISFLFRPKTGANIADPYPFHINTSKKTEGKKYKKNQNILISDPNEVDEYITYKNIDQTLKNIDPLDDADGNKGRQHNKYKSKNGNTIIDDITEGERYKAYEDINKNTQSVDQLGPAILYRYDRRPSSTDQFFKIRNSTFQNRINIDNMTNTVEAVNGLINQQFREKQKNMFPSKNYFSVRDKKISIKHPAKYNIKIEQVIPTQKINYPNSKVGFQKKRKLKQPADNKPKKHPTFRPDQSKNYHNYGYVENSVPINSYNSYISKDEFGSRALDKKANIFSSETGQLTPDANALINMHNIQSIPLQYNDKSNQPNSDAKKYTMMNSFVNSEYGRPLHSTRSNKDLKHKHDEAIQYASLLQTIAEIEKLQDDSDIIKSTRENIDKNYLQSIYRQDRSSPVKASRSRSGYVYPKCKDKILY